MTIDDLGQIAERAQRLKRSSHVEFWSLVTETASLFRDISPNRRRLWLVSVTDEMWRDQDGNCALCLTPMARSEVHVDHVIPFCYGGGNERSNIQLAHPSCNRSKGTEVHPSDLLRYLESRYMNR